MALTQELNHGRLDPRPTTRFESKKRPSCYKKRSKPSVRFVPVWLLNSAKLVRTVKTPFTIPETTSAGGVASPATLLHTVATRRCFAPPQYSARVRAPTLTLSLWPKFRGGGPD